MAFVSREYAVHSTACLCNKKISIMDAKDIRCNVKTTWQHDARTTLQHSIDARNKNAGIDSGVAKKGILHGEDVLQDVICLQELPFGWCCRWRVGIGKGIVRQGVDLGRDREQLAQLPLSRRYDCTAAS